MVVRLNDMFNYFLVFFSNFIRYRFFFFKTKFLSYFFNFTKPTILSRDIEPSKKIVIYGFGPYGEDVFVELFSKNRIEGIYDKKFEVFGSFVKNPNLINSKEFEYVVVTVMDDNARKTVINFLKEKNIPEAKIIYVDYIN